jgi:L-rhamnose-H+ transport protein
MIANPFLGVVLHAIGGLASASFYIPYKGVKQWAWETYWLVGGFFSWIIAPWCLAIILVPNLMQVLANAPPKALLWSYIFGCMWGLGGLTFGLTMRYLGIALGMAIALGYCAAFGTLMPPIFSGEFTKIASTNSGLTVLAGVVVCLAGIAVSGMAGMSKERELSDEQKKKAIKEFNFLKGLGVATFSGILSASMSYGFAAGKPIAQLAIQNGTPDLWQNIPVLVVVLAGGFTTNFIWCILLQLKNKSFGDYTRKCAAVETVSVDRKSEQNISSGSTAVTELVNVQIASAVPLKLNYLLCAIAGTTWYLQFFFYGMGTTKMGKYDFSSWTLHMASIIIFSTLWGVALKEWKGSSIRTHVLIAIGLAVLIASTIVVGYGNYLGISVDH